MSAANVIILGGIALCVGIAVLALVLCRISAISSTYRMSEKRKRKP